MAGIDTRLYWSTLAAVKATLISTSLQFNNQLRESTSSVIIINAETVEIQTLSSISPSKHVRVVN